ncbi:DoxX family protein [Pseudonocardia halophobica]|uniref:DoxX family protein n=1 Tax=Pseudonocardia halophobica TaxID=29401 RepID=UPI003D918F06
MSDGRSSSFPSKRYGVEEGGSSRPTITQRAARAALPAFRVVAGFLFACHGAASLFGILGGAHGRESGVVAFAEWPSWWAALIQLVGGTTVALGLATRTAAIVCSGSMGYAYFMVHQGTALLPIQNGGEAAALYCWIFLLIAALGPGPVAVDSLPWKRERGTGHPAGVTSSPPPRRSRFGTPVTPR